MLTKQGLYKNFLTLLILGLGSELKIIYAKLIEEK
jgi:hypothetical protein